MTFAKSLLLTAALPSFVTCTQVQRFRSDAAVVLDDRDGDPRSDVALDVAPAICRSNGFAAGPVRLTTGGDATNAVVARSGAELFVAWRRVPDAGVSTAELQRLDPGTLTLRGDPVTVDTAPAGTFVRELAITATSDGVAVLFDRMADSGSAAIESHLARVDHAGQVHVHPIPLGRSPAPSNRASAVAYTGDGFGVTYQDATSLYLARLDASGEAVMDNPVTVLAPALEHVDSFSALGWAPDTRSYIAVYRRQDTDLLQSTRIDRDGTLDTSIQPLITAMVQPVHRPDIVWTGRAFGVLTCLVGGVSGGCRPTLRTLASDGTPDAPPVNLTDIYPVDALPDETALAWSGRSFGVVWSGQPMAGESGVYNLHFATVDEATVHRSPIALLPTLAIDALSPSIGWAGDAFVVAWEQFDMDTSTTDVYVAKVCNPS